MKHAWWHTNATEMMPMAGKNLSSMNLSSSCVGRHSHSGPYGTDDWLRSYGEHLEVHAAQIRRNLAAWERARP